MSVQASIQQVKKRARKLFRRGRRKTPTVLQMEAVECGAASLAMILGYYHRWVSLEELRIACGVSRDGSKASNVCKAARSYGLAARGFRKEPDQLTDMPVPAIIHWNFNHYVVFEGKKGRNFYINDPAFGQRVVSKQEFDEAFTGVYLAFERTPEFVREGRPQGILGTMWRYMRGSRLALVLVAILTLALVVPGIVIPVFAKIFVDDILLGARESWLVPLVLAMTATAFLRAGNTWLQQHLLLRIELKLSLSMASRMLDHVMKLPIGFFNQRSPGDVANRVAAADRVATLLSGDLASSVLNATTAVFLGLVMIGYDPQLAAVVIALASFNFIALSAIAKKRQLSTRNLMNNQGKLFAATAGSIRSIETIKASGLEDNSFAIWSGHQAKTLNSAQSVGRTSSAILIIPTLISSLTSTAVLCFGAFRVMRGELTLGDLVAFQALAAAFVDPIGKLVGFGGQLQMIQADLARIEDVLRHEPVQLAPELAPEYTDIARLRGHVEMKDISFGYSPLDAPLIKNFNLTIQPGRRIALVGGSGSGKTTIGRLIAGIERPHSGNILLDGEAAETFSRAVLGGSIAYVDQEVFLFEGSVRDNITLWDDHISDGIITQALHDAAILDDVDFRPGGLQAHVAEGGINFSGGQRQRLEIARALALQPAILILDEATAALDPVTEALIDDSLRRRGMTCIIIAHRLSTIRDCDEIIVLRNGQAVERGTHETLLAANCEYSSLVATN